MSNLTILNTAIRQTNNLFNLNDLHTVAGNEDKHRPAFFIRLGITKDLVTEIQKDDPQSTPIKTLRGTQGGTYACEEIALAYAMWISPKFHLVVLRAFIAMHKGNAQPQQPALPVIEERTFNHSLKNSECVDIGWLWFGFSKTIEFVEHITPALEVLGSQYAPRAHSIKVEYGRMLNNMGKLIHRITREADFGHNPAPLNTLCKHLEAQPKRAIKHYDF